MNTTFVCCQYNCGNTCGNIHLSALACCKAAAAAAPLTGGLMSISWHNWFRSGRTSTSGWVQSVSESSVRISSIFSSGTSVTSPCRANASYNFVAAVLRTWTCCSPRNTESLERMRLDRRGTWSNWQKALMLVAVLYSFL